MKKIIILAATFLLVAIVLFVGHAINNKNLSKAIVTAKANKLTEKKTTKEKVVQAVANKQPQQVQPSQSQNTVQIAKTVAKPVATPSIPKQTSPPVPAPVQPQLLIDKIKGKGNAEQAIVVTTNGFGIVSATITTFEKDNGTWRQVCSFEGNVGVNGFAYNKVEGDGHSPIGIFSIGTAFGRYSNPGTAMNYRQSTPNDFWVDDPHSSLYNTWQEGPVNGRWASAENMYIPQYNYGFVINYNTAERTPGKGSAIFFHVWSGPGNGTAGCTATAQDNVISTLRWLNPSENPVIIEGPMSEVLKM
jgi:L,D-peptidoglycan transpeptidase YkuD (ErfK/YbiS/YcfS/YnhG family)